MQSRNSLRQASAFIIAGGMLAALVGLAPTPVVVRDRFTDNNVSNNFWLQSQVGVTHVNETHQRLEFNAATASASESFAGLEVKKWGANWKQDFEIEIDYKLNLANVTGDDEVLLGIGLGLTGQFPEDFTGFGAYIGRDASRVFLVIARYTNGGIVTFDETDITATQGQLTVEWDRSSDQISALADGQEVHLDGPWADLGGTYGNDPMVIAIGCLPLNGNRPFPGSRVWIDEFKFDGVKRTRL